MARVAVLFPPICSCSKPLGTLQQDFEEEVIRQLKHGQYVVGPDGLKRSAIARALDTFKLMKMCCRSAIINCPMYFIRCTDLFRFRDDLKPQKTIMESMECHTPLIVLKRLPPPFPTLPGDVPVVVPKATQFHLPDAVEIVDTAPAPIPFFGSAPTSTFIQPLPTHVDFEE